MTLELITQANPGPAPFPFIPARLPPAEPVPFRTLPVNLSPDEIRTLVRDLLG